MAVTVISSGKVLSATKWSTITELLSKLVVPISSMILARLLAPQIFGIVASISTVTSFCEIFIDAGFQKYIIQRKVQSDEELKEIATIAFWTNLIISIVIFLIIWANSSKIAMLVGANGLALPVVVASLILPINAVMSIPNALLRRALNFKVLFFIRIITVVTPFIVTLPIAYRTHSYWALIIGNIVNAFFIACVTLIVAKWVPSWNFNFVKLKQMLSFSLWSMFEAFLIWIINWGDVFIVTFFLSEYYLGIYKTSMNMMNSVLAIISASIPPVLLSSLSCIQDNKREFKALFYKFSYYTGILLIPLGIGLFIYRETICEILLGGNWMQGALLMGTWGLVSAISILFSTFSGCVYIAKGMPKVSAIIQLVQIVIIIPVVYYTVQINFDTLSYSRALVRIPGMIIHAIALWKLFYISVIHTVYLLKHVLFAAMVMALIGWGCTSLQLGLFFNILSIFICMFAYTLIIFHKKETRTHLLYFIKQNVPSIFRPKKSCN